MVIFLSKFGGIRSRIKIKKSLVGVLFILGELFLFLSTQQLFSADVKSVKSGNWSDPQVWSGGTIPSGSDNVLVDSSHVVLYDVNSSDAIRLIHIRGKLEFSRTANTNLVVGMIIISTKASVDVNANCSTMQNAGPLWYEAPRPILEVGSMDNPIPVNVTARIQLKYFSDMDQDCAPGIVCYAGRMDFHGAPMNKTWLKLGAAANQESTILTLADPVDWRVGDHVIITGAAMFNSGKPGSYRTNLNPQTEENYIASVSGNTITLTNSLQRSHRGTGTYRCEVGNLTRNVVVESLDPDGVRGHTMYHHGSRGSISYTEFRHLGKAGRLARYPIHYHVLRATNRGSSVIGASIWDSHNRFVTVHGTDYMVVKDCVGYKSLGHGFFLEDASEVFNLLQNNLSVLAYNTDPLPNQALPYDQNDGAGFWFANGRNAFIGNVAAECDRYGFQLDIQGNITRSVLQPNGAMQNNVHVNRLAFISFKNNEAHGILEYGFWGNGDATANDPFVIDDLLIWRNWRAIGYNGNNYFMKNIHMYTHVYGIYGDNPRSLRVEGMIVKRMGNTAVDLIKRPEGLMTFEDVLIDTSDEHPIKIRGQKARPNPCDVHFRNYSFMHINNNWDGARSELDAESSPDLTLYLHDYFGPDQDAKVIPSTQTRNDGLNYQDMSPVFEQTVKVAITHVPFPQNPINPVDVLPPATVIIYPANEQAFPSNTTSITVRGTCIDASQVTSVTVNGVPATPLEDNYTLWEVTLPNLQDGQLTLTSEGVDQYGNHELNPHTINIGIGTAPAVGVEENPVPQIADNFSLIGNYPNPFNPETTIKFTINHEGSRSSHVVLTIYNIMGQKIRTLVNGMFGSGEFEEKWDGRNDEGMNVGSGLYLYEMVILNRETPYRETKKMLLVR